MTYGYHIWWTGRGESNSVTGEGFATPEEAKKRGEEVATKMGWTRPRWWQWWRRGDYK